MGLLNDDDEELPAWLRGPAQRPVSPEADITVRNPGTVYGQYLPVANDPIGPVGQYLQSQGYNVRPPPARLGLPEILRGPAQIGAAVAGEGPTPANAASTIATL